MTAAPVVQEGLTLVLHHFRTSNINVTLIFQGLALRFPVHRNGNL